MAPALIVTDQVLDELIVALRTSLVQVQVSELPAPSAQVQYEQVQHWLADAERFRGRSNGDPQFVQLRAFPLSGVELRALQAAVERAVQARTVRRPEIAADAERQHRADLQAVLPAPYQRLIRSIQGVHLSSAVLAAILALSLAVNVAGLVVLHIIALPDIASGLILGLNVGATAVALGLWGWHQWQVVRHVREVHWHMPHLTHHGHAA